MLLQPLVENAVIHGIAPQVNGGDLLIRSLKVDSRLELTVKNSGARRNGKRLSEHGIGLKNCVERLKTIYGTNYRFELNWPHEGGCEVTLDLPFAKERN